MHKVYFILIHILALFGERERELIESGFGFGLDLKEGDGMAWWLPNKKYRSSMAISLRDTNINKKRKKQDREIIVGKRNERKGGKSTKRQFQFKSKPKSFIGSSYFHNLSLAGLPSSSCLSGL